MASSSSERRRLRRVVSRIPARYEAGGLRSQGYVKNLHKEGLFLRCKVLPRTGDPVRVSFETGDGHKVDVEGLVRWTTAEYPEAEGGAQGFGVKLDDPGDAYLAFFESILLQ